MAEYSVWNKMWVSRCRLVGGWNETIQIVFELSGRPGRLYLQTVHELSGSLKVNIDK